MARILLIGGHGKVALLAYPHLTSRGHDVTGVIRNPEQSAALEAAGAEPVVADVEHLGTKELETIMRERAYDVVVWSAGAGGGNPDRTYAVDRDAAIRSMVAAENAGIQRFIMVSYLGSSLDHGIDPSNSFFHYAEAKAAADEYLRSTALDWTILGPGKLTLEPASGKIETASPEGGEVSRENVALVIVETIEQGRPVKSTLRFNDGDTSIADAVARA